MKYFFHPEAMQEFGEAVDYYEECEKGLGIEFVAEIYKGIELISQYPEAWHLLSKQTRRYLISRFPYGVIYRKNEDSIFILAIMQLNREPNYWKKRH